MYPLRFEPLFRQYLWGGRRLGSHLGKPIGDDGVFAESWEIVDHGDDQSVVKFGTHAGRNLQELIAEFGPELLGNSVFDQVTDPRLPDALQNRFPLLFKFLDANKTLSVQVHPDDELASLCEPADLGKTEAWYVMEAEPDAKIYAGLKSGVDSEQLLLAVEAGETESVLHSFSPQKGDCIFIPAGVVHAIGKGLLVAEIQQSSDTTYRLFDWNRVEADGNPRELHIHEAVHATNYNIGPVQPAKPKPTDKLHSVELVNCDKFVMNRWSVDSDVVLSCDDSFRILVVTKGELGLENDPAEQPLKYGETALIPACFDHVNLNCDQPCEFLEIFVPGKKS